jgi:hypothetical protein
VHREKGSKEAPSNTSPRFSNLLIDTSYAVIDPAGDSASGRAEETIFFHKKFALCANFL